MIIFMFYSVERIIYNVKHTIYNVVYIYYDVDRKINQVLNT